MPTRDDRNPYSRRIHYRAEDRRAGIYGSATQSDRTYDPNRYREPAQMGEVDPGLVAGAEYGGYGRGTDFGSFDRGEDLRVDHTGRGPKGYQRSDERIQDDAFHVLERHPRIDASDLEIAVKDGVVTLKGHVMDRTQKRLAEDAVEGLFGVRDVLNQIAVQNPRNEEP